MNECSKLKCLRVMDNSILERVFKVEIGLVLLASVTSAFNRYRKLAYCSSAQYLTSNQKVLNINPQLGSNLFLFLFLELLFFHHDDSHMR